ncbi:MAG: hypothetical protein A2915_00780 [Candidatus Yanofskybacteria bacterium RIFCSPLOWO2_01_FULL_41_34]|uniref:Septum formation initiator n=1 Tax=Candidatus Yanofskybacteria bacterium RIFCSPHIGHO2_01_FULL_41_26 TaxID=1802661 RepID=A0A1F8ECE6_9BACT|nr:MAG: hypothetical protein A2649_02815 [Candidatus Yanofskybacteria bacterium RIFCSPHIGHO2_01_FULL_41_26]OGN22429.1 MAG: hypothetical protein A2915_00780 [Candidatus Yanofskybacteria bacterium RIFCSPLOWO2_01_FULL_41_34]
MKFLNSKIFTVLSGILVLWLTLSSINIGSQRSMIDGEVKNIETKIKEVQNDTDYLNKFLNYFQTPAFLEKEARLKLNYKVQGEEVVFVYRDKNVKKESDPINFEELLSKMPNYKKWFWYVLGY